MHFNTIIYYLYIIVLEEKNLKNKFWNFDISSFIVNQFFLNNFSVTKQQSCLISNPIIILYFASFY